MTLNPVEQNEVLNDIARELNAAAPPGWERIRVVQRSVGRHDEVSGQLTAGGRTQPWLAPLAVDLALANLRRGMRKPGAGTWFTCEYWLEPNRYNATYDYDNEPSWSTPPSRAAFVEELTEFPRTEVPEWLSDRAAGRPVGMRQARPYDGTDAMGRPTVRRPPMDPVEIPWTLAYLQAAPVVLAARSDQPDAFDPAGRVPVSFRTDGEWIFPDAVAHYLRKHGVPPEPDLVAHLRRRGFRLRPVSDAAQDAALATLTGRKPTAPANPVQPGPRLPDESEEVTLTILRTRLDDLGVHPAAYGLGAPGGPGGTTLERDGDGWQVRRDGEPPVRFTTMWEAATHLLGAVLITPERGREPAPGPGPDPRTPQVWPFGPTRDDPPESLFADRQLVALPAGTELDRFGEATGSLTFAAGTLFGTRSLPPDWLSRPYHVYRVERLIPAVRGTAVAWFDQPGGGTGYLLAKPVADLLAEGSLREVPAATVTAASPTPTG